MSATGDTITALADELARQGIQRIVVESTSDYWRPFVDLLAARGLTTRLVNARGVKGVPGRLKSDRLDALWLTKLNERGMLRPSFIPPPPDPPAAWLDPVAGRSGRGALPP